MQFSGILSEVSELIRNSECGLLSLEEKYFTSYLLMMLIKRFLDMHCFFSLNGNELILDQLSAAYYFYHH